MENEAFRWKLKRKRKNRTRKREIVEAKVERRRERGYREDGGTNEWNAQTKEDEGEEGEEIKRRKGRKREGGESESRGESGGIVRG